MSGLNYKKLGSTLVTFVILPNLTTPLNATTPSKISGENPVDLYQDFSYDAPGVKTGPIPGVTGEEGSQV